MNVTFNLETKIVQMTQGLDTPAFRVHENSVQDLNINLNCV